MKSAFGEGAEERLSRVLGKKRNRRARRYRGPWGSLICRGADMNPERDQSETREDVIGDEAEGAGVRYEPPAIVVLGSVDQLTAQEGSDPQ